MTQVSDPDVYTPYASIRPLTGGDEVFWAPPLQRERIAAYTKYEEIYWSFPKAFRLVDRVGEEDALPIYVPNARTIVDTTSHFWLKGLSVTPSGNPESEFAKAFKKFMDRETFLARFHTAKHSGVNRGDFVMHITADPNKADGGKISITSLDPSCYFVETDPDDVDKILAVDLVEQIIDELGGNPRIRRQRYEYRQVDGTRRVESSEAIYEPLDWWDKDKAKKIKQVREPKLLPERVTTIPVYHFKNIDWQGEPFGASELRGYELIQAAVNQATTDEDLALALHGLGVYATDASGPVDSDGNETDWEIAPAKVMEVPGGSFFRRVEGLTSVSPVQDHLKFLVDSLYESSATFRGGQIEAQVAESGVALAIKFLPTLAKLEQRDESGLGKLRQMFFDWCGWLFAYENIATPGDPADAFLIELGPKLPFSRTETLNELNNMLDRKVISKKTYREQIQVKLGYELPADEEARVNKERDDDATFALKQQTKMSAVQQPNDGQQQGDGKPPTQADGSQQRPANKSNNRNKPNESGGTEADQGPRRQSRPSGR